MFEVEVDIYLEMIIYFNYTDVRYNDLFFIHFLTMKFNTKTEVNQFDGNNLIYFCYFFALFPMLALTIISR